MGRHDNMMIRFSRGSGQNFGKVENKALAWSRFCMLFSKPPRTSEKLRVYAKLSDKEQTRLKSTDGFFYRTQVEGKKRNRSSGRPSDLITLDFDNATPEFFESILSGAVGGHLEWMLHTTRRHTPEKPRFRLILPLPEPVTTDIYSPVSRIVALIFDPEFAHIDKVSFRPAQMMFMPTVSADSEFIHKVNHGDLIDWQSELDSFEMIRGDWRDVTNWPTTPGEEVRQISEKAEVPTDKQGPVGDFCRAYDVPAAIAKFLPDVYEESDGHWAKPRYTYLGGTTSNGAEVQDDGLFLYSHHGSDPCADMLVNAFDLVRLHKFGEQDEGIEKDTPIGQRPSFKAMLDFIKDDPEYGRQVIASRYDMTAMFDDAGVDDTEISEQEDAEIEDLVGDAPGARVGARALRRDVDEDDEDLIGDPKAPRLLDCGYRRPTPGKRRKKPKKDWHLDLERGRDGNILSTSANIAIIIQNDVRINECMEYNQFTQEIVTRVPLKTRHPNIPNFEVNDPVKGDLWQDHHTDAVRMMLEAENGPGKLGWGLKVADRDLSLGIRMAAMQLPFHPIKDILVSARWDGSARIPTLFPTYLKTEDNSYYRDIAKLWWMAAVARVFEPGHKFDFVPILEGGQGVRKSTFIKTLGCGFFGELTANLHEEQKLVENMQGSWVMELPELSSIKRSDVESIKAAITRTTSIVRLAYDRRAREFKRQVVFMGSTNEEEYLVDRTGNRRWWPVKVQAMDIDTDALAAEMEQIVAEALQMYLAARQAQPKGELPLYLTNPESRKIAELLAEGRVQDDEADFMSGRIEAWLLQPESSSKFDGGEPAYKEAVCTAMIWQECLGMDRQPTRMDQRHIGQALRRLGWGPCGTERIEGYGKPKVFRPVYRNGKIRDFGDWLKSRERPQDRDDDNSDDDPLI